LLEIGLDIIWRYQSYMVVSDNARKWHCRRCEKLTLCIVVPNALLNTVGK